jgi:hypothetical protein
MRLNLKPTSADYGINFKTAVVSTILNGGNSKFRRTLSTKSKTVNVSWILNPTDYEFIMVFYFSHIGTSFTIPLITENGILEDKVVRIVPSTFTIQLINQQIFKVKCVLEILK